MDEIKYSGYEFEVINVSDNKSDAKSVCRLGSRLLESGCYAFEIRNDSELLLKIDVFTCRGEGKYSTINENSIVPWKEYGVDESFWKEFESKYVAEDHSDDGYYIFKDDAIKKFGLIVENLNK